MLSNRTRHPSQLERALYLLYFIITSSMTVWYDPIRDRSSQNRFRVKFRRRPLLYHTVIIDYEQLLFFLLSLSSRAKDIAIPRLGFRAPAFAMSFPQLDELKRKNRDCS